MTDNASTLLPQPDFVERDPITITTELVAAFESVLGKTLYPAQVERILLDQIAYRETLLRIAIQETGKQNLAQYAADTMLDHLGALTGATRLDAQSARVQLRFSSAGHTTAIAIAAGMPVQTADGAITFLTAEDAAILPGETFVDVWADATEGGSHLNGITPGQLGILTDPPSDSLSVANITTSTAGSDAETDTHYRERVMLSPERDACGTVTAYRLAALSTHPDILDVSVTSESAGCVIVSASTATGAPDESLLDKLRTTLNDENFKPLTDQVTVISPQQITFSVALNLTLYPGATSGTVGAVRQALEAYTAVLRKTLGNDLVPSRFITLAQQIEGVQSVELISPEKTVLSDHQYADCTAIDITVTGVSHD